MLEGKNLKYPRGENKRMKTEKAKVNIYSPIHLNPGNLSSD